MANRFGAGRNFGNNNHNNTPNTGSSNTQPSGMPGERGNRAGAGARQRGGLKNPQHPRNNANHGFGAGRNLRGNRNPSPKHPSMSQSGLPNNGQTPKWNGPHGRNNSPQSGLPDNDKNTSGQSGLPNDKGKNNGGRQSGLPSPLGKIGNHLPQGARDLADRARGGFNYVSGAFASSIRRVSRRLTGRTLGKARSLFLAHLIMSVGLVGGLAGVYGMYHSQDQTLYSDPVCSLANDGNQDYSGADDFGNGASSSADETANAKKIFMFLVKKEGFSGAGAAGACAVAERESNFNPSIGNAGGGVVGIFQWSGWSSHVNGDRIHSGGFIKSSKDLTIGNELKLVDYELHHDYSNARKIVGHDTDPKKAAMDWSVNYEGVAASDGQTKGSMIEANAQKWYAKFDGQKYHANNSLLGGSAEGVANDNAASADQANNSYCNGGSGDDDADTSDIVKTAKALEGYFTYANTRPVPPHVTKDHSNSIKPHDLGAIDKHGTTDCSGYVWLVASLAGYHPSWGPQTAAMASAAEAGKGLKKIPASETKPGDIAITNGSGDDHTVILLQHYHGGSTKIVNEGGSSSGAVHEETIATAYGQYWNHYLFARMIKE